MHQISTLRCPYKTLLRLPTSNTRCSTQFLTFPEIARFESKPSSAIFFLTHYEPQWEQTIEKTPRNSRITQDEQKKKKPLSGRLISSSILGRILNAWWEKYLTLQFKREVFFGTFERKEEKLENGFLKVYALVVCLRYTMLNRGLVGSINYAMFSRGFASWVCVRR